MGMIFCARLLTGEELAAVRADPSVAEDLLLGDEVDETETQGGEDAEDGTLIDIDKAWHGIHYLLTGTAWEATTTLGRVILGGAPLDSTDAGYGPVRLLEQREVADIAAALSALDDTVLRARFDPSAMERLDIYPSVWAEGESVLEEYLLPNLAALRKLYAEAAATGSAVIAGIT
jgi:hypothetical protein